MQAAFMSKEKGYSPSNVDNHPIAQTHKTLPQGFKFKLIQDCGLLHWDTSAKHMTVLHTVF